MYNKSNKQHEFTKLYLTGKYTQKALAERLAVSKQTANRWVHDMPSLKYINIRKQLITELERLTEQQDYEKNRELISCLFSDIERLNELIYKTKYI